MCLGGGQCSGVRGRSCVNEFPEVVHPGEEETLNDEQSFLVEVSSFPVSLRLRNISTLRFPVFQPSGRAAFVMISAVENSLCLLMEPTTRSVN